MQLSKTIDGPVAVIGDVHGQVELLDPILEQLSKLPGADDRWIVFIGDLVDRGIDSRGVIQRIIDLQKRHPKTTSVMGNHELAMGFAIGLFDAPEYTDWAERWCEFYGAEATFASYEAEFPHCPSLRDAISDDHKQFLTNLPWAVEHPEFFFVHAGLDPNQPFEMQRRVLAERDFSLARPPWLCSKDFANETIPPDCPQTVVSGHVPVPEVQAWSKRILIDTTGGTGGELSCVLLPERQLISSADAVQPAVTAPPPPTPPKPKQKRREPRREPTIPAAVRPKWYEFWK